MLRIHSIFFLVLLQSVIYPKTPNKVNNISLVEAFPNLSFSKPVFLTHSNDGSNRIFVVEQSGRIKVYPNNFDVTNAAIFLNIENRVNDGASEMGLLGLAFHPDYANNGFFYVNYTTGSSSQRRTVISRFSVDARDPNQGNPNSEFTLMQFSQPFSNHNGGMIQFASDGYLYIATGDGGSSGDPQNNAQNRVTLLGKILRLDVDNPSGGRNYGIPATNPFAGNSQGFREEIWAYGLRNPWRFSFDSVTNQMWAGDVGQGSWEEIDLIEKGQNYGWNCMEGTHGFPPGSNCSTTGLTLPIVEYSHSAGISVTGGYVYRGSLRPELEGAYVYADFGSGRIWLLRHENDQITADSLLLDTSIRISSFGVDENNELYIIQYPVSSEATKIFRFAGTPPTDAEEDQSTIPEKFTLEQNYPNPFNPTTIIKYHLAAAGTVDLTVYNLLGQKIRSLVNAYQGRGEYQVAWDGKNDLGEQSISGIYYYQLKANSFIQTRKMILMK